MVDHLEGDGAEAVTLVRVVPPVDRFREVLAVLGTCQGRVGAGHRVQVGEALFRVEAEFVGLSAGDAIKRRGGQGEESGGNDDEGGEGMHLVKHREREMVLTSLI